MSNKLPSKYQFGDVVDLEFYESGRLSNCRICKVHFSVSKVLYDIEMGNGSFTTRIHNIDSCFVIDPVASNLPHPVESLDDTDLQIIEALKG